jgi:hypothetical protein
VPICADRRAGAGIAGLTVLLWWIPAPAWAHEVGNAVTFSWSTVAVRAVVLVATAGVAGTVVLADRARVPPSALLGLAGIGVCGDLLSTEVGAAVPVVMAQVVLTGLTALLCRRILGVLLLTVLAVEAAAGHAGVPWVLSLLHTGAATIWIGAVAGLAFAARGSRAATARRLALPGVGSAFVVTVTGVAQAVLDRVGWDSLAFDRVVQVKAVLLLIALAAGARAVRVRVGQQALILPRVELGLLCAAALLGASLPLLPAPPPSGRVVITAVGTVTPGRPGRNLVHVASGVQVNGRPSREMAGADGGFAWVDLPPGRSTVKLGGVAVAVDTGRRPGLVPDGPECASAQVAAALRQRSLLACPEDALSPRDRTALAEAVAGLANRGVRAIDVVGDETPRSLKAQEVVRSAARSRSMTYAPGGASVLTGGWSTTTALLQRLGRRPGPPDGLLLAPWLLSGQLLAGAPAVAGVLALPFDPGSTDARAYRVALPVTEAPTASGYAAWGGRTAPARLWAYGVVQVLPTSLAHGHRRRGWLPGGTLTAVSRALAREVTPT